MYDPNGYPDNYISALNAAEHRDRYAYSPMSVPCPECGAEVEREGHDAMCIRGWIEDMPAGYTDDSTDIGDR